MNLSLVAVLAVFVLIAVLLLTLAGVPLMVVQTVVCWFFLRFV